MKLALLRRRAFRLRPRPITSIVIFSFIAVTAPFLISIIHASHFIKDLAQSSEESVFAIVQVTRNGNLLLDQVKGAERALKQYKLFRNTSFHDLAASRLADIRNKVEDLRENNIGNLRPSLDEFSRNLEDIQSVVLQNQVSDQELQRTIDNFESLYDHGEQISQDIRLLVDSRVTTLNERSIESRRRLISEITMAIPIAILLITIFSMLFRRSMRQLEMAVADLGDNNLAKPVRVSGPRDIRELGTKLNWLRLRLQELENEKQKFLRHMSHELKTPVANFQEGSALLAEEIPGPLNPAQKEVVAILQLNVQQFKQHITNLLDYNLVKFNRGTNPSKVGAAQLVDEIVMAHKLMIEGRDLQLHKNGANIKFTSDRSMLKAALDNVISNSINFSPDGGRIDISWEMNGGKISFEVIDDGPGLKPEEINRIFDPFYQGEARRRGPLKGSGIGLSVAKECAISLGGDILARNQANRGACFEIKIPDLEKVGKERVQ